MERLPVNRNRGVGRSEIANKRSLFNLRRINMTPNEQLKTVLESVGNLICERAEDISRDIEGVRGVSISCIIDKLSIPEVSIEKRYYAKDGELVKYWGE